MKMLANPTAVIKHFLDGYTEFDEQPHPDGHGLVALQYPDGTFLSWDDNGNPNGAVTPPGHAPSAGANERFNATGGGYIHDKSKAAMPRAVPPAGLA